MPCAFACCKVSAVLGIVVSKPSAKNTTWRSGFLRASASASSGEYTVSVRFRDENGERHSVEFVDQWSREDDQEVLFEGEYFMGENVDLISARARKVSCVCAPTGEEDDKGEEE